MNKLYVMIFTLFLLTFYFDMVINKNTYTNGKPINDYILPDIIHNNFPEIKKLHVISDLYTTMIGIIFFSLFIYKRAYNYIILWIILFYISRFICYIYFSVTTLPDCSKRCVYSKNFFETTKNRGSCNNLNISGHFINICIQLYLIYNYFGSKYWILYILAYIIGFLLICVSRNHYTIDCINSTIIALLLSYEMKNITKILNYIIGKKYFTVK